MGESGVTSKDGTSEKGKLQSEDPTKFSRLVRGNAPRHSGGRASGASVTIWRNPPPHGHCPEELKSFLIIGVGDVVSRCARPASCCWKCAVPGAMLAQGPTSRMRGPSLGRSALAGGAPPARIVASGSRPRDPSSSRRALGRLCVSRNPAHLAARPQPGMHLDKPLGLPENSLLGRQLRTAFDEKASRIRLGYPRKLSGPDVEKVLPTIESALEKPELMDISMARVWRQLPGPYTQDLRNPPKSAHSPR